MKDSVLHLDISPITHIEFKSKQHMYIVHLEVIYLKKKYLAFKARGR